MNDNNNSDMIYPEKLNLDELYEKKKQSDIKKVSTYNKILKRIHSKIKVTSRQRNNNQCCWYVIPEIILGVPIFDHVECINYIMEKLDENGFRIKYTHPNLLFIAWNHWIPGYVRNELKKKTGIQIDGYGNKIIKGDNNKKSDNNTNPNDILFGKKTEVNLNVETLDKKKETDYKEIDSYKPSGSIYDSKFFKNLENKLK